MSKLCKKCLREKNEQDFYSQKGTVDGLKSWCKECCKHYQRDHHRLRREKPAQRSASATTIIAHEHAGNGRTRCMHSFTYEIEPGHFIRFFDIPDDLTQRQANKLKRLITAYVV